MKAFERCLAPGAEREIITMRPSVFGYLEDVKMTRSFLTILQRSLCVGFALMLISGCEPVQEQILGTYLLDADRGCSSCQATGPERMVFADDDISDGIPGAYRFEFADGELHSGTCLLYTSPSPRDRQKSRMPSSA